MANEELRNLSERFADIMVAAALDPITGETDGENFIMLDELAPTIVKKAAKDVARVDAELGVLANEILEKLWSAPNPALPPEPGPEDGSVSDPYDIPAEPQDAKEKSENEKVSFSLSEDLEEFIVAHPERYFVMDDDYLATAIGKIQDINTIIETGKATAIEVVGPDGKFLDVPVAAYSRDGKVEGVFSYPALSLREWENTWPGLKPCPLAEVEEREPNYSLGVLAGAKVKIGRRVYALGYLSLYVGELSLYARDRKDATAPPEAGDEPDAPAPLNIELDEDEVDEADPELLRPPGHSGIIDDDLYLELERMNRVLYAVKLEKSEADRAFNEQIKEYEEKIRAQLRYISSYKDQYTLPFDDKRPPEPQQESAPGEPEKAVYESPGDVGVDAQAEEPDDEPILYNEDGEVIGPDDEVPTSQEPPETHEKHEIEKVHPCHGCDGTGFEHDNVLCSVCNGEAVRPATRGNGTTSLKCFACGSMRPAFSFQNFRNGSDQDAPPLKGHICSACRSQKRPARI